MPIEERSVWAPIARCKHLTFKKTPLPDAMQRRAKREHPGNVAGEVLKGICLSELVRSGAKIAHLAAQAPREEAQAGRVRASKEAP